MLLSLAFTGIDPASVLQDTSKPSCLAGTVLAAAFIAFDDRTASKYVFAPSAAVAYSGATPTLAS